MLQVFDDRRSWNHFGSEFPPYKREINHRSEASPFSHTSKSTTSSLSSSSASSKFSSPSSLTTSQFSTSTSASKMAAAGLSTSRIGAGIGYGSSAPAAAGAGVVAAGASRMTLTEPFNSRSSLLPIGTSAREGASLVTGSPSRISRTATASSTSSNSSTSNYTRTIAGIRSPRTSSTTGVSNGGTTASTPASNAAGANNAGRPSGGGYYQQQRIHHNQQQQENNNNQNNQNNTPSSSQIHTTPPPPSSSSSSPQSSVPRSLPERPSSPISALGSSSPILHSQKPRSQSPVIRHSSVPSSPQRDNNYTRRPNICDVSSLLSSSQPPRRASSIGDNNNYNGSTTRQSPSPHLLSLSSPKPSEPSIVETGNALGQGRTNQIGRVIFQESPSQSSPRSYTEPQYQHQQQPQPPQQPHHHHQNHQNYHHPIPSSTSTTTNKSQSSAQSQSQNSPVLPPLRQLTTDIQRQSSLKRQSTISPVLGGLDRLGIFSRHSSPSLPDRGQTSATPSDTDRGNGKLVKEEPSHIPDNHLSSQGLSQDSTCLVALAHKAITAIKEQSGVPARPAPKRVSGVATVGRAPTSGGSHSQTPTDYESSQDNDSDDDISTIGSNSPAHIPKLFEEYGRRKYMARDETPVLCDMDGPGSPLPGPQPLPDATEKTKPKINRGMAVLFRQMDPNYPDVDRLAAADVSYCEGSDSDGGDEENKKEDGEQGRSQDSKQGAPEETEKQTTTKNSSSTATVNGVSGGNSTDGNAMNGGGNGGGMGGSGGNGGGDDNKRPRNPSGHGDDIKSESMEVDEDDTSEGARKKRKIDATSEAVDGLLGIGRSSPPRPASVTYVNTGPESLSSVTAPIMTDIPPTSATDMSDSSPVQLPTNIAIDPALEGKPSTASPHGLSQDILPPMVQPAPTYSPNRSPTSDRQRPHSQHSNVSGKGPTLPGIDMMVKAMRDDEANQAAAAAAAAVSQHPPPSHYGMPPMQSSPKTAEQQIGAGYGAEHVRPPLHHMTQQQRDAYHARQYQPTSTYPYQSKESPISTGVISAGPSPISQITPFPFSGGHRDLPVTSPPQQYAQPYYGQETPYPGGRRDSITGGPGEWNGSQYDSENQDTPAPLKSQASPAARAPRNNRANVDPALNAGGFKCQHPGCTAAPFQTQYLLNSHANVHSSARPHYCPVKGCPRGEGGKGFKRKNEMIRHGLVHQSPGYACPFCPAREHKYPRPDNLQRHVRVHHPDKDRDHPQLREVLAQRPEGGQRGRRRRGPG